MPFETKGAGNQPWQWICSLPFFSVIPIIFSLWACLLSLSQGPQRAVSTDLSPRLSSVPSRFHSPLPSPSANPFCVSPAAQKRRNCLTHYPWRNFLQNPGSCVCWSQATVLPSQDIAYQFSESLLGPRCTFTRPKISDDIHSPVSTFISCLRLCVLRPLQALWAHATHIVLAMCIHVSMCPTEIRKNSLTCWNCSYRELWTAWHGCWKPISGPSVAQQAFMSTEPSRFYSHVFDRFIFEAHSPILRTMSNPHDRWAHLKGCSFHYSLWVMFGSIKKSGC